MSVQLKNAEYQLQSFRETINRTNDAILSSRAAIDRADRLIEQGEFSLVSQRALRLADYP